MHLTESILELYNRYANPLILLLGDFNDLKITDICESCSLKQVVNVPTRMNAILDLIMTNLDNQWYEDPITLPSISNSDHLCVLYFPKMYVKPVVTKEKIMIRVFKKSAMIEFGSWIVNYDWTPLFEINDADKKNAYFSTITWLMIDKFFPLKKIDISSSDKEWITPNIKNMIKERHKAHLAQNIDLRNHLEKKIRSEIRKAKLLFNEIKAHLFHTSNPREWYRR